MFIVAWPALVRVASRFDTDQVAQVHQQHTPAGYHISRGIAFLQWVDLPGFSKPLISGKMERVPCRRQDPAARWKVRARR
jgi:hypothetical protein